MDQPLYDQNGNFNCVQRTNADGSTICFTIGSPLWAQYVAQNGMPSPTGASSYPALPLTQNQQNAIAALKAYAQTAPGAQTGISAQQDALNRQVLVVLKLIGSQLN